jgi:hypothetical protein
MRPVMARQFKPVRFFAMMAAAAFVVCGVTAFYTHRAAHGRTAEERAAYAIGERTGEETPHDAKLPTAAELNMMAQKQFKQEGIGNQLRNPSRAGEPQAWHLAFENGYTDGFKKTHPQ